jgi:hypothetical protein
LTRTYRSNDFRSTLPRFTPEALKANQALIDLLGEIGKRKHATPCRRAISGGNLDPRGRPAANWWLMICVLGLGLVLITGAGRLASFVTEDQPPDDPTVSFEKDPQDDGAAPTGLAHWSELESVEEPVAESVAEPVPRQSGAYFAVGFRLRLTPM